MNEKQTEKLFERYLLADKLYESLKTDVNQEVSDDEARVMRVKQIYITDQAKAQSYLTQLRVERILKTLAQTVNEADAVDITVNRSTFSDEIIQKIICIDGWWDH